jgi:hypothetical protein
MEPSRAGPGPDPDPGLGQQTFFQNSPGPAHDFLLNLDFRNSGQNLVLIPAELNWPKLSWSIFFVFTTN